MKKISNAKNNGILMTYCATMFVVRNINMVTDNEEFKKLVNLKIC